MFEKVSTLKMKASSSAFHHSLVSNYFEKEDIYMIACLDVDSINIVKFKFSEDKQVQQIESKQVKINSKELNLTKNQMSLKYLCKLEILETIYFGIISSIGIHVYDKFFSSCVFELSNKSCLKYLEFGFEEAFISGLCCLDNLIFIGNSVGSVLVFNVEIKENEFLSFYRETLNQHSWSITTINSATDDVIIDNENFVKVQRLSIADALGTISVWHLDENKLNFIHKFIEPNGYCCVSTVFYKDLLIAAYNSGHIKIYNLVNKILLCEVQAHARTITSLNICPNTGYLLTTSEDTFLRIWILYPNSNTLIDQSFFTYFSNFLVNGAKFVDVESKLIAVTAYDEKEICLLRKN